MKTYRQLFSVAEFRVLFLTQCLAVAAGSIGSLALGTITFAETGSALLTGLSMFGGPLVMLVGSALWLSSSDLWRPRTALLAVDAVVVLSQLLQVIPGLPWWVRFLILALPWLVMSATSGTTMALVADLLPDSAFVLGRSTMNIAVGVMQIVGYGLGGILLGWLTTRQLFLTAAGLGLISLLLIRTGIADHPPRASGRVVKRTRAVNRTLLRSPVIRPIYLALWVPNGLVVGCESLFIPYAHDHAGYLLAGTAAGMLLGDVVVGRFVGAGLRDRLIEPLRLLLALPYVLFLWSPPLALALVAAALASIGYAAGLGLQERLVSAAATDVRGHALGLRGTGMMVMQAVGALIAGALADVLGPGSAHAAQAVGIMALASLLVTVALVPGLARSRPPRPPRGTTGTPDSPPARRTARPER